mmetsp:Transcript_122117/g.171891  ORF Transcript_122117/g.171891 Transcript_122117/m.171891 type:complete len:240 (+) Transcript_122117:569-1288(+)
MDDEGHDGRHRLVFGLHRPAGGQRHRHRSGPSGGIGRPRHTDRRAFPANLDRDRLLLPHEPSDPLARAGRRDGVHSPQCLSLLDLAGGGGGAVLIQAHVLPRQRLLHGAVEWGCGVVSQARGWVLPEAHMREPLHGPGLRRDGDHGCWLVLPFRVLRIRVECQRRLHHHGRRIFPEPQWQPLLRGHCCREGFIFQRWLHGHLPCHDGWLQSCLLRHGAGRDRLLDFHVLPEPSHAIACP